MSCEQCSCDKCVPSLEEFGSSLAITDMLDPEHLKKMREDSERWRKPWREKQYNAFKDTKMKRVFEDEWMNQLSHKLFVYMTQNLTYSWDVAIDIVDDVIDCLAEEILKAQDATA